MAKREGNAKQAEHRRPATNKVKLHKYYKGIISLQKDPIQQLASKHMWVNLLKEVGQYRVG